LTAGAPTQARHDSGEESEDAARRKERALVGVAGVAGARADEAGRANGHADSDAVDNEQLAGFEGSYACSRKHSLFILFEGLYLLKLVGGKILLRECHELKGKGRKI
jgi:hypothetical protein